MGEVWGVKGFWRFWGLLLLSLPQMVLQSFEDKETTIKVLVMQELNNENNATTKNKSTYIGIA